MLAAVAPADIGLLRPYATLVELVQGEVLFEPEEDVLYAHFPLVGTLAALVVLLEDGRTAEAVTMGCEGAIGGIISAGHKPAFARAVVEIGGPALRIETARIEHAKEQSPTVRELFSRYADVLLAQLLQSVTCNALHSLPQRFARCLLMTQDRMMCTDLPLTQEAIGEMLGAHRATVIRVAKAFQEQGLIAYGRGRVRITDRPGLEATSCECYGVVRKQFAKLLPQVAGRRSGKRGTSSKGAD